MDNLNPSLGTALSRDIAESELRRRYGNAIKETKKIACFSLSDGREIGTERGTGGVKIWIEGAGVGAPLADDLIDRFSRKRGRHSNLSERLTHAPTSGFPREVAALRPVPDLATLCAVLDWYEGDHLPVNRAELEVCRAEFLARYPDFIDFDQDAGCYWNDERSYKQDRLRAVCDAGEDIDAVVVEAVRSGKFISWQAISGVSPTAWAEMTSAVNSLIRGTEDLAEAMALCATTVDPILTRESGGTVLFAAGRTLVSAAAALVHPHDAMMMQSECLRVMGKRLIGRGFFADRPLAADEVRDVTAFARKIFAIMQDDWNWRPRDLWDVQSFLWAIYDQARKPGTAEIEGSDEVSEMTRKTIPATNLILYGPPGTGKTFATAARAVALCDGSTPVERSALMARYRELVTAGQIAFVTFHQSYAYEDFVEGLRPETALADDGIHAQNGFHLAPRNGVFKRVANLALATHADTGFSLEDRRVFKMSIGQAGIEDDLYDAAVANNYVALGYGGEIDWSDPKYAEYAAVRARWHEIEPGINGNSGNIAQIWCFRAMRPGDLVVVSRGNSSFRAIAEITGDYYLAPEDENRLRHRRSVRWLRVFEAPLPVETIYGTTFTQSSCYRLNLEKINAGALLGLLPAENAAESAPAQFVLIIDEINRANISKVFGELITLLEPDKRLGRENELTVTLPYSGERFGVPANLHVIGTMNTADRSIALLDTALRRRFRFEELMPEPDRLVAASQRTGVDLVGKLRAINERIEFLFDREHQIGHAYFMSCTTAADVDAVMRDAVIPLLAEYFFDDWEKIRSVLADDFARYVEAHEISSPCDDGETRWSYRIRSNALSVTAASLAAPIQEIAEVMA